ncbi:hypothetical protein PMAG_a3886 [Pseudoalteromonas mariniglutinosa NCIMB 1770]|nr:hypothetical protein [Pseudoalteromonas mariniglutinosa NCIMB 1770]
MNLKATLVTYKNIGYQLLGLILVGLGIVGIVLPVMPTTIFFILALACFTRSSPKLAAWLLNHPRYGTTLRHWQDHKIVPTKAKWYAGLGMSLGFILLLMSDPAGWVIYLIAVIESVVMIYLISRPSALTQPQCNVMKQKQIKLLCIFMAVLIHGITIAIIIYKPVSGAIT